MRAAVGYALTGALLFVGFAMLVDEAASTRGGHRGLLAIAAMCACSAGAAHLGRAIRAWRISRALGRRA